MDKNVRVGAKLKQDAIARSGTVKAVVHLDLIVEGERVGDVSCAFEYQHAFGDLSDVLDRLKKERTVELLSKLNASGALEAAWVRIGQSEYLLTDDNGAVKPVTLLP